MSEELPKLFSDEEFNAHLEVRERRASVDRRVTNLRELGDFSIEERRVSPARGRRSTDGLPPSTIEQKFPHIATKLTALWRSEAFPEFIASLSIADRADRAGFPEEVMEDLMLLQAIDAMLTEEFAPAQKAASPFALDGTAYRKK